jgi:hypothetical protein
VDIADVNGALILELLPGFFGYSAGHDGIYLFTNCVREIDRWLRGC